jgi:hypothetical protein
MQCLTRVRPCDGQDKPAVMHHTRVNDRVMLYQHAMIDLSSTQVDRHQGHLHFEAAAYTSMSDDTLLMCSCLQAI